MKDMFSRIFEREVSNLFNSFGGWQNEPLEKKSLQKETFEITKGDYTTIANLYFDKNGFLVSVESSSKIVPAKLEEQIKKLESLRDAAASKQDYLAAHRFQQDIEEKKKLL